MKKLMKKSWSEIARSYELSYICDTAADVESLPTEQVAYGSTAIVVAEGAIYFFSPDGSWKKYGE